MIANSAVRALIRENKAHQIYSHHPDRRARRHADDEPVARTSSAASGGSSRYEDALELSHRQGRSDAPAAEIRRTGSGPGPQMNVSFDRRIRHPPGSAPGSSRRKQLEQADGRRSARSVPLAQVVTEKNMLSESELLAGSWPRAANLPPIDLDLHRDRRPGGPRCCPRTVARAALRPPDREDREHPDDRGREPVRRPALDRRPDDQTGCELRPVLAPASAIERAIARLYSQRRAEDQRAARGPGRADIEVKEDVDPRRGGQRPLRRPAKSDAVVKLVNMIIYRRHRSARPTSTSSRSRSGTRVRYRDGRRRSHEAMTPPKQLQKRSSRRLKIMA